MDPAQQPWPQQTPPWTWGPETADRGPTSGPGPPAPQPAVCPAGNPWAWQVTSVGFGAVRETRWARGDGFSPEWGSTHTCSCHTGQWASPPPSWCGENRQEICVGGGRGWWTSSRLPPGAELGKSEHAEPGLGLLGRPAGSAGAPSPAQCLLPAPFPKCVHARAGVPGHRDRVGGGAGPPNHWVRSPEEEPIPFY